MEIKIGNKTMDIQMYCYAKIGSTENLRYKVDGEDCLDYKSVIDKVSNVLANELDKEYDNENN